MKPLGNSRFDLAGNSFFRVLRINILNKFIPLGNFRLGIGFRPAVVLLVLHYFGGFLFSLLIRNEHRLHRLYGLLTKER